MNAREWVDFVNNYVRGREEAIEQEEFGFLKAESVVNFLGFLSVQLAQTNTLLAHLVDTTGGFEAPSDTSGPDPVGDTGTCGAVYISMSGQRYEDSPCVLDPDHEDTHMAENGTTWT